MTTSNITQFTQIDDDQIDFYDDDIFQPLINDDYEFLYDDPPPPPKLSRHLNSSIIMSGIQTSASKMAKVCICKTYYGWVYIVEPIYFNHTIYYKYSCYLIHDDPFKYNRRTLFNILFNTQNEYEEFYTIQYDSKKIKRILDNKLIYTLNEFLKKAQNKADDHNFMDIVVCDDY